MRRLSERDPLRGFEAEMRAIMLMAQDYRCMHCPEELNGKNARGDHIHPHSHGGQTGLENLQILCRHCNGRKSNRVPQEEIDRDLAAAKARMPRVMELIASGGNPPGSYGVRGGDWAAPDAKHHVTRWNREREVRGGIPAPHEHDGWLCHRAWQVIDRLTRDGVLPTLAECKRAAEAEGLNKGNMGTEYPRWKSFNGFAPARPIRWQRKSGIQEADSKS